MDKITKNKLGKIIDKHREQAVICCDESCWCWALDRIITLCIKRKEVEEGLANALCKSLETGKVISVSRSKPTNQSVQIDCEATEQPHGN